MATLWEKFLRWKKPKMLKEDVDYRFFDLDYHFADGEDRKVTAIEILKGKFKGVAYHYTNVRVVEEGMVARLQFGYVIGHPGEHKPEALKNDEEFVTFMGALLEQILEKKTNEPIRTDYNQEPDLQ